MSVAPARLGLTATPPPPGGALEHHVGGVVYALGVADLVGEPLADFAVETVPIELAPGRKLPALSGARRWSPAAFSPVPAKSSPARAGEFAKAAKRTSDGRAARRVACVARGPRLSGNSSARRCELLARHTGERVLVFTADNAATTPRSRASFVSATDLRATSAAPSARRCSARFHAGDANVLVSAQVLDEELDVRRGRYRDHRRRYGEQYRHVLGRVLQPRQVKRATVYELATAQCRYLGRCRRRHGLETSREVVS